VDPSKRRDRPNIRFAAAISAIIALLLAIPLTMMTNRIHVPSLQNSPIELPLPGGWHLSGHIQSSDRGVPYRVEYAARWDAHFWSMKARFPANDLKPELLAAFPLSENELDGAIRGTSNPILIAAWDGQLQHGPFRWWSLVGNHLAIAATSWCVIMIPVVLARSAGRVWSIGLSLRRTNQARCPKCGHLLTIDVDGARCTECGHVHIDLRESPIDADENAPESQAGV